MGLYRLHIVGCLPQHLPFSDLLSLVSTPNPSDFNVKSVRPFALLNEEGSPRVQDSWADSSFRGTGIVDIGRKGRPFDRALGVAMSVPGCDNSGGMNRM